MSPALHAVKTTHKTLPFLVFVGGTHDLQGMWGNDHTAGPPGAHEQHARRVMCRPRRMGVTLVGDRNSANVITADVDAGKSVVHVSACGAGSQRGCCWFGFVAVWATAHARGARCPMQCPNTRAHGSDGVLIALTTAGGGHGAATGGLLHQRSSHGGRGGIHALSVCLLL